MSKHLKKYEAIRKEMSEIRNEISRIVPERSEESIEDEWQGYCAQLSDEKSETEDQVGLLGLIWLSHNHEVEKRKRCPELYERLDDLRMHLEIEDKLIAKLKWMHRPFLMSRANYDCWQEYHEELNSSVI